MTRHFAYVIAGLVVALLLAACSTDTGAPSLGQIADSTSPGTVAVTIGDSITGGHGLRGGQAWPALLAADHGWKLVNLGSDGSGFRTVGNAGDTFDDQVRTAIALKPGLVIISGSSNDFGQNDDDLDAVTSSTLQDLRSGLPDAKIFVTSAIWGDLDAPAQIADIDGQVERGAARIHATYLDIGQPLAGNRELLQHDDMHPTAAGQRLLAEAIGAAITRGSLGF